MENKKLNIYLLYAIALLQGMIFYGPIATLYRRAQGLSMYDITLIESISLTVMILLELPWGYVSDKIGYKKTIVVCNILYFISKIVFWKADNFFMFAAERLILSVVLAGISGCDSAYLYLSADKENTQSVFGIYEAMSTAGLIFASLIFSVYVNDNYETAAFLTVVSYGAAMLSSLFLIEVRPETNGYTNAEVRIKAIAESFMKDKAFIMFLLAASLLMESNQIITVFLSQVQYLQSGILPKYMGYIYILVTVSGMLSAYSHIITDRIGEGRTIKMLFCTAAISCISMSVVLNPVSSVLCIVLMRISASVFIPISINIKNRRITTSSRATMLSVYSAIMNITAIMINLILGKMADINIRYAMVSGALFCGLGLILYAVWESKERVKN
ncbi:MFS transporter [Sedimentibacter sp.]|uniref:MFS transporter n=1 Tax=Sedimentibacter sp. TaxID=1960295 RepID=UPI0028A71E96|nr:MFS transporter [Sedimentibacter sp.]